MLTKTRFLALLLSVVLLAAFMPTSIARAADDDFEATWNFDPDIVGTLGADMTLNLGIRNTGITNITKVRVDINTGGGGYFSEWSTNIRPGQLAAKPFPNIPFAAGDVDEDRVMMISIQNDADANWDGIKIVHFTIHSKAPFKISATISPASGPYRPGDTVTVTYRVRNEMPSGNATNVSISMLLMQAGGGVLVNPPTVDIGTLTPGLAKTATLTYTLREADVGRVEARYVLVGDLLGRDYMLSGQPSSFNVTAVPTPAPTSTRAPTPTPAAPPPTEPPASAPAVEATAALSATPAETAAALPAVTEAPAQAQPSAGIPPLALYIVIAVLLLAVGGLVGAMFVKRNK